MVPYSLEDLERYVNETPDLRACLDARAGDHLSLELLAQGEYNVNYRVRKDGELLDSLIRVNTASQMGLDDQIGYEMGALALLGRSGVTPAPLYADGSRARFPCGVGAEAYLPGRPLDYGSDLPAALRSISRVHALPVPDSCALLRPAHPLSTMLEECERLWKIYGDWARADAAVVARVDGLFARARAELASARDAAPVACIVNTELNSGNFLVSPGAPVFIIDWEKPLVADPVQDLAHLLAPTTTFWKTDVVLDRSQMEGYLSGYVEAVAGRLDVRGIEDRFGRSLRMTCLRGISWCAMAQVGYAEGTHAAANADTERKIASYLTEEFLSRVAGICGFA